MGTFLRHSLQLYALKTLYEDTRMTAVIAIMTIYHVSDQSPSKVMFEVLTYQNNTARSIV